MHSMARGKIPPEEIDLRRVLIFVLFVPQK